MDIDDTLSTEGKLTAEAFASLWALKKAGFAVVPITGRPAGWCDHIARFWPVDAVVGENGAFTFFMHQGIRKRLDTPTGTTPAKLKHSLDSLALLIKKQFPEAKWASDQGYREFDLAIDFCEDVPPWPKKRIHELVQFCLSHGAHAKVSSIHVNTWFGQYDKKSGFDHWLKQGAPGLRQKVRSNDWIFIGDSPNDEPLFASFSNSVGVANLKTFLSDLNHPPRWITQKKSGEGFSEMAKKLIRARPRR